MVKGALGFKTYRPVGIRFWRRDDRELVVCVWFFKHEIACEFTYHYLP